MQIACIWEHNGDDTLLWARDFPGAFTRGASLEVAMAKMPQEIRAYMRWRGMEMKEEMIPFIAQEKASDLAIRDADSDVIFATEQLPMTRAEYEELKAIALKSAADFLALYRAIPDKGKSVLAARDTFYGQLPRTAEEMYLHTKNVNAYYFGEIDVAADNEGDIWTARERGFALLEEMGDMLEKGSVEGSYGEEWSLRKVLRRFIWHDRIHAKAMWRMAEKTFGAENMPDIFCFRTISALP